MRRLLIILVLLVFLLSGCNSAPKDIFTDDYALLTQKDLPKHETYALNPARSTVLWNTVDLLNETRSGFVAMDKGIVLIDDRQVVSSTMLLDMETFTVSQGPFSLHIYMNDYDFFDTYYYPEGKFSLRSINDNGNGTFELRGMLELVDVTREISFNAKLFKSRNDLGIKGTFEVDVLRWGIVQSTSPSYEELGAQGPDDKLYFDVEWLLEEQ